MMNIVYSSTLDLFEQKLMSVAKQVSWECSNEIYSVRNFIAVAFDTTQCRAESHLNTNMHSHVQVSTWKNEQ